MNDIAIQYHHIPPLSPVTSRTFHDDVLWRDPKMETRFAGRAVPGLLRRYKKWTCDVPPTSAMPVQMGFWMQDALHQDSEFIDGLTPIVTAQVHTLAARAPIRTARLLVRELSLNDGNDKFMDQMAAIGSALADSLKGERPMLAMTLAEVASHVRQCSGAADEPRDAETYTQGMWLQAAANPQNALAKLKLTGEKCAGKYPYSPRSADAAALMDEFYKLHPDLAPQQRPLPAHYIRPSRQAYYLGLVIR